MGFLVVHLSELSHNRQEEALQLPYRLLREVLKSDRLTSLSEDEIWKVLVWSRRFSVPLEVRRGAEPGCQGLAPR